MLSEPSRTFEVSSWPFKVARDRAVQPSAGGSFVPDYTSAEHASDDLGMTCYCYTCKGWSSLPPSSHPEKRLWIIGDH